MTSEKELRKIVSDNAELRIRPLDELRQKCPGLTLDDWGSVLELVDSWPIPDLPPGDRHGYWWPKHGRNYGNVHISHADPDEIVISRGGPGEASRHTSMTLTLAEAEELASLLLAAALHERNQS